MTINYENIHQAIAALNQCAKENEKKTTDTGAIIVSDLCADVSYFLCKVQQDCNRLRNAKDGMMHVYVFHDAEDGDIITDLWTCGVPDVGEYIIIWKDGAHHHYEVTRRIYGANADEKVGAWNIYVTPQKRKI